MQFLAIEYHDGVAVLRLNDPNDKINKLGESLLAEFTHALNEVENSCKALVLISGKPDGFIAGADIELFAGLTEPGMAYDLSRRGQALLDRLAGFQVPTLAAIRGPALGGGLEVALACQYRLAADDSSTVFALPEVKLGLLPGLGGTQRLPRLVGLTQALDMLLTGKNIYARKALKLGLVDRLLPAPDLEQAALAFASRIAERPMKRRRKRRLVTRLLEGTPPGRVLLYRAAGRTVRKQTFGNYPAPIKILECVRFGMKAGMKRGLENEAWAFDELVRTPQSRQLVNLFFGMTATRRNPFADQARPVRRIGLLGAGLMGSGIAEITALKEIQVTLKEVSPESLERGEKMIHRAFEKKVRKRIMTDFERDRLLARIHGTTDYLSLSNADLVIEAVFEDLDLKRQVLAEVEEVCREDCIFASNTSCLPIARIAERARRPEQVIGMHYFSPVPKMPLLEIIVTDRTAAWVKATAVALGVIQGKNVIVVHDGPGFYTTRILAPMLNEAILMLEEGIAVEALDRAMLRFGFPVGPATLMDEVGIDVGAHVSAVLEKLFAQRGVKPSPTLTKLSKAGYKGRKNGKGFYRYDGKRKWGKKPVNTDIYRFLGGSKRKSFPEKDIQDRLSMAMVNEAVWCLEEKIVACPRDGDLGAVLGLGFPPFLGGPFRFCDSVGIAAINDQLDSLAGRLGPRFKPAPILAETTCFHNEGEYRGRV